LGKFNLGYKITGKRVLLKKSAIVLTHAIRGAIRDEITNAPLPGITILVKSDGIQLGASSDSLGNFSIKNVPVGRISIVASCIGFNTRNVENVLLGTGKELFLDLKMSESVTAIDEVVVTRNKRFNPWWRCGVDQRQIFYGGRIQTYAKSGDPARMITVIPGITSASDESNALL
jgi:hypothetical protein